MHSFLFDFDQINHVEEQRISDYNECNLAGRDDVVKVIEQCCFNSAPDPFNGQTVNFILKPPKSIESRTYVKKEDKEHYRNNTDDIHSWSSLNLALFRLKKVIFRMLEISFQHLIKACPSNSSKIKAKNIFSTVIS